MPLLLSPISGEPMKQVIREGIEIDVCPTTGGIWLDKGELEKLIAFLMNTASDNTESAGRNSSSHRQFNDSDHDDDDDDDDDDFSYRNNSHRDGKGGKREKRQGGLARMMDIFDFG